MIKEISEQLKHKLKYYDIVDETKETIDYEKILICIFDLFIEEIIDDKIEHWHTHDTGNKLSEFLGLSQDAFEDIFK